jgi:hypothetical protein
MNLQLKETLMTRTFPLCFLLCLVSFGCGSSYIGNNSGGSGGTTNYAGQAQGVYSGTASSGYSFSTIVLPNDKFYGIYGTTTGNTFYVYGMLAGQGTSGKDSFTANVTDYLSTGQTASDTLTATDVPGQSVNGTITENGTPVTFNGTALASSSFNFNTAASVGSIVGAWNGSLLDGITTAVTINSIGTVTGTSSGCSFTGTITADGSGKNFYDVSITFGSPPCALSDQTATGVAIYYLLPDGVTHQLLAGVTLGNSGGTAFFAQR